MDAPSVSALANGVRVLSEPRPGAKSVALLLLVDAGPVDERPSEAGAGHFVEHMLFRGSRERDGTDLKRLIDGLGGLVSAHTGRSNTAVEAQLMAEDLPRAIAGLTEMIRAPRWSCVDTERRVLLEELRLLDADAPDLASVMLDAAIFGRDHPYGRPIAGRPRTLARLGREQLAAFHARTYVGRRIAVGACGAVEHGELVEAVRAGFGPVPAGASRRPRGTPSELSGPSVQFRRLEGDQTALALGVPAVAEDDPRRPAVERLDLILGGLEASLLREEIRERLGLAYEVESVLSPEWSAGRAAIHATVHPDNVTGCMGAIGDVLATVRGGRFDAVDWQAAERAALARLVIDWDGPESWLWHHLPRVLRGEAPRPLAEERARLEAVSRAEVTALADELWAPERLSAVGVGPDPVPFRTAMRRLTARRA